MNPTLDQLQIFVAVVELRSFSGAARRLRRSQSVVSYSIGKLEEQLGVILFDREITKRPQLTIAGRAVLDDARRLLSDVNLLRARVKSLNDGVEGEVGVAISNIVPFDVVVEALRAFGIQYPTVSLNVTVGTLGTVVDAIASSKAVIGFGGIMVSAGDNIAFELIGQTEILPVAAPDHPLAALRRPLEMIDVRDETQLVVTDASGLTQGRYFNVFSIRTWRVSDNATKHLFIRSGLGWGGLPISLVQGDIANGRLVALNFPGFGQSAYGLHAISNSANPLGPAARWLLAEMKRRMKAPKSTQGGSMHV